MLITTYVANRLPKINKLQNKIKIQPNHSSQERPKENACQLIIVCFIVGVIVLTLKVLYFCNGLLFCYFPFPFPYTIFYFICLYNFTVITQCACDNLTILQMCRFADLQIYRFISFQPCSSIIKINLSLLLFFAFFFLSFCFYNMLLASSRH